MQSELLFLLITRFLGLTTEKKAIPSTDKIKMSVMSPTKWKLVVFCLVQALQTAMKLHGNRNKKRLSIALTGD